jgi:hypothetical protein
MSHTFTNPENAELDRIWPLGQKLKVSDGGKIIVVGKHDYDELMGTLSMLYGMPIVQEKSTKTRLNEFMGMVLVPSYSIEKGFYFGSEDLFFRETQDNKKSKTRELAEKLANAHVGYTRDETVDYIEKILTEHDSEPT